MIDAAAGNALPGTVVTSRPSRHRTGRQCAARQECSAVADPTCFCCLFSRGTSGRCCPFVARNEPLPRTANAYDGLVDDVRVAGMGKLGSGEAGARCAMQRCPTYGIAHRPSKAATSSVGITAVCEESAGDPARHRGYHAAVLMGIVLVRRFQYC